jgi:hypothetical protein
MPTISLASLTLEQLDGAMEYGEPMFLCAVANGRVFVVGGVIEKGYEDEIVKRYGGLFDIVRVVR